MKWCYYFRKGGGVIAFYFFNSQKITHFWNDDLLCSIKNKLHSFALHAVKNKRNNSILKDH